MGVSLQPAALPSVPLADNGSYVGVQDGLTPQAIRVAVDLSGGRIGAIRVLQHPAWRTRGTGRAAASGHRVTNHGGTTARGANETTCCAPLMTR